MNGHRHATLLDLLLAAGLFALAGTLGCGESTAPDPVPPGVHFVYTPESGQLVAVRGEPVVLSARAVGIDSFQTVFTKGDDVLASTPEFTYVPAAVGLDSVLATVTWDGVTDQHLWRLNVTGPGLVRPPQPRNFQVIITDQIYVTWTGELDYDGPVALSRYELRYRARGVVDEEHWDVAIPLAEVPYDPDRTDYLVVVPVEPPALPIGAPVGFALRLRDSDEILSEPARDDVFIPSGYIVEGTVTDMHGQPLAGVEVRWSYCDGRTYTDANGRYQSYLLPPHELVGIRYSDDGVGVPGTGDYYDAAIQWRVDSERVQNVMLLPVASIDPSCGSYRYDGDFLNFMRDMTYTDPGRYYRQAYVTARWAELPISYYVVEQWSEDGSFALHALADSAVTTWNERLEATFFVPAPSATAAQLLIYFDNDDMGTSLAVTRIVNPVNGSLNFVVPQKMTIQARTNFPDPTFAFEVLLHEVAHAFCIGGHSLCESGVHLLRSNPQGIIAERFPESPIHDDEVRLIRMMYALSPFHPLGIYRVD